MKKTFFSTILFFLFISFVAIIYLSFFGYETDKFNQVIKSEINKSNKDIKLNFDKISVLLDVKKLVLFVKFLNSDINYLNTNIPLMSLRADVDLEFLTKKKIVIKKVSLSTKYLDFNKVKPLLTKFKLNNNSVKNISSAKFQIKDLNLEFDENFKLKQDLIVKGDIKSANIKISNEYMIKNLKANFMYKTNFFNMSNISCNFINTKNIDSKLFNGEFSLKEIKKRYHSDLSFETKHASALPKISFINYSFIPNNISKIKTKFVIDKNSTINFETISIKDKDNIFQVNGIILDKNYNLINFKEILVKTSLENKKNNEFTIINKDSITVEGKIFDAKVLIKEIGKDRANNKFLNRVSKDIVIDFNEILKGPKFPIKNFRLIGKIKKGSFEKITAKSDFTEDKHLDITLKNKKNTNIKVLEVYSDIATPLLSDYNFFKGLYGGTLYYVSEYDDQISSSILTINNFKLNNAPALAKILSLADLKGLFDSLKGEGISFDTLSIKYNSNSTKMDINEIFMIGPSISILIDGYVERKSGLVSLRGTLVPAKTLNSLISKIPVVGDILIGKKIGEGIFGISFKIKGTPNNLKTTVNPIKTLTPRFITRALEAAKKKKTK